ncbi:ribosomal protein L7/L12 [Myceligenerans pegani]|uniref:Ribosomal protein L7/L12 n=1 Tax=Myceligenerans pegani TaxID=2776917 RepID=A0ABR9N3V9_9MICO|nr:ribosomal protein L7/L12 [Myceligenerans sp. TRM 65318]MBE1877794.1 ribosomal protein L7/L12 [Myceligenerans sp. TRM 65318]MBE3020065.1 ribosomal protein L7/L12 [Myceligenerans sp. TRM 65318]
MKHGTRVALFLVGALVYTSSVEGREALAGWFDGVLWSVATILLVLAVRHPAHDVVDPRSSVVRVLDTGGSSRNRVRAILGLAPLGAVERERPPGAPRPGRGAAQEGWIVAYGLTRVRAEQAVAHLAVRGIRAVRDVDPLHVVRRLLLHAAPVVIAPVVVTVVGRFELLPYVGPLSVVVVWAVLVFLAYLAIDVLVARRGTADPEFSVDGPFTVRLVGMDATAGRDAVELISALCQVAALGLDDARTLFRTIPATVAERVTAAEADRYRTALERAGATVEVVGR